MKKGEIISVWWIFYLLRIESVNNGNTDISKDDIYELISFQINHQAKILEMSAIDRSSGSIQVYFDLKNNNNAGVTPDFFKPGE
jgi:hypothetical protein